MPDDSALGCRMTDSTYIFAGNRFFVLEKMLQLKLPVLKVLAVKGSYLEKELIRQELTYVQLVGKEQLVEVLKAADFDIFISNGCPYLLPISELSKGSTKRFVNIHPSLLPNLKGADPVPGALLHQCQSGATCHLMNDHVDSGDIISQSEIKMSNCLDGGLLYQLSFLAEQEVFLKALQRGFSPQRTQVPEKDNIYYTLDKKDLQIRFEEDAQSVLNRIKAFCTQSQGAYFKHRGEIIRVHDAEIVKNQFLLKRINGFEENEIVFNYENRLLIRKGSVFLKLKQIDGDISDLHSGCILA